MSKHLLHRPTVRTLWLLAIAMPNVSSALQSRATGGTGAGGTTRAANVTGVTGEAHEVVAPVVDLAQSHRLRAVRLAHRRAAFDSAMTRASAGSVAALFTDTLQAGLFRLTTSAELRSRTRAAAERLSVELDTLLDDVAADSVRGRLVFVRHPLAVERRFAAFPGLAVSTQSTTPWQWSTSLRDPVGEDPLTQALRGLAVQAVTASMDDALRSWLLNASIPIGAMEGRAEHRAQLDVATSESRAARQCVSGNTVACARLLALRGRPTDALRLWYAPEDYRSLVSRLRVAPSDDARASLLQRRCLAGTSRACGEVLALLGNDRIPAPSLEGPRVLLLQEALRMGGAGAMKRLRSTAGDIGTRLAAASGIPEDSLLSRWQRRVIAPAGGDIRPRPGVALATVGWALLLAGFGMRRTRRCR